MTSLSPLRALLAAAFTFASAQMGWGQVVYQHNFGTTTISGKPYTVAPTTLNANLSSSSWTTSASGFTDFTGSSGRALALSNSGGTPTITLTFNVASGFTLDIASLSFWRQRSSSGAQNYSITINGGSPVATGTAPTSGTTTGSLSVSGKTGLTGTVTLVISLSGASGTGTFRIDDFTINGTVAAAGNPPTVTTGTSGSVANTSALVSGNNVTTDGGLTVTERGVVFSTSANPTTANGKAVTSGTTGSYDTSLTGLLGGTLYHARAFATNSAGTSYGSGITFTTDPAVAPSVTTGSASTVGAVAAILTGNDVSSDGGAPITERGIVFATTPNPTTADSKQAVAGTTGAFDATLTGLSPTTTYYARAFATNSAGTTYGDEVSFTTTAISAPTVVTGTAGSIGTTTATISNNEVIGDGGSPVTERGVVYATSPFPTTASTKLTSAGTTGTFNSNLTGLTQGTVYYLRAYAINAEGTSYGAQIGFATNFSSVVRTFQEGVSGYSGTEDTYVADDATTTNFGTATILDIDGENPVAHGIIRFNNIVGSDGTQIPAGSTVTTATLRFNVENSGTTLNVHRMLGAWTEGSSTWNSLVSGIQANNTEAATTVLGTFSNPTSGSTSTASGLQTAVQAWVNGETNNGFAILPTGTDGVGLYSSEFGTSGSRPLLSVTYTPPAPAVILPPTVVTGTAGSLTPSEATISGNDVTSDGGGTITERGIVYATTQNPTTANSKVAVAGTTGAFDANLTGLSAGTLYYARAFATNSAGTDYGAQINFTTSAPSTPTLTAATLGSALTATFPSASTGVSFTAAGANLTGNITVTAETGYEVSTTLGSGYGGSVVVASGTTVYVRFAASRAAGNYNSATAAVLSGGGASSSANITTSSSGNTISAATPPTLTAAPAASVDAAFDVTFTDNATWRTGISGITVDGTPLTAGFAVAAGTITFTPSASVPAGLLQSSGTKEIVVTSANHGNAPVSQAIAAGAATQLAVTTQPAAPASNGAALATQPIVQVRDQYNNLTTSTATVTAAVGAGTWTLGGTAAVDAVSGTTTFAGLTATSSSAVTGATIGFTSPGLTGATSATFNIPAPDFIEIFAAPVMEDFDGMAATTALPNGWKMAQSTASPTWSAAATAVTQQASSGTPTTGGTYNWGSTASERAVGAMTSGGFASPNSLLVKIRNSTGGTIDALEISYQAERYRINSAAASVQLFYSLNGTTWTAVTAGDIAASEFPTGTSSYTFASPLTITRSGIEQSGLGLADGAFIYFRWNINTTGSNSQGIGIDDISISLPATPQTITGLPAAETRLVGAAAYDLAATASSSLTVSYSSSDEAVATISGATVTIVGPGTTTITASQAGDATYAAATPITQTLTVLPTTWTLIENFTGLSEDDPLSGQNDWANASGSSGTVGADPANAANLVGILQAGDQIQNYKNLAIAGPGQTATMFLRFRIGNIDNDAANNTESAGFMGVSDAATPSAFSNFRAQWGTNPGFSTENVGNPTTPFHLVSTGTVTNKFLNQQPADSLWYHAWAVLDKTNAKYSLYLQGGEFTTPTLITEISTNTSAFDFRGGGNLSDTETLKVYLRSGIAANHQAPLYFDDIYLAAGENLSSPVPPSLVAAGSASIDAPFTLTFADDSVWRAAITEVTVDGTPLTTGFAFTAGQLTLTPSSADPVLQTVGTKSISVQASGYASAVVDQAIGPASTPLGQWLVANFGSLTHADAGLTANPDNDGLTNAQEFAFGTDPEVSDSVALTVTDATTFTPGTQITHLDFSVGRRFTGRFVRRKDFASAGLTYTPQFGDENLDQWANSPASPVVVSDAGGDYEVVEVPYIQFMPNGKKARFFRMSIMLSE